MHSRLIWGFAVVSLLAVVVGGGVAGAQTVVPGIKVGLVDLMKVNQNCDLVGAKNSELGQWAQQQDALLNELRNKYGYLSEENFREIVDILQTPRPLPAAKAKRERDLRELNDQKESRLLELQAKVDRSTQEQEEFNQLQEIAQGRAKQIGGLEEQIRTQYLQKRNEMLAQLTAAVQDAVKAVATENGYNFVFDRDTILFGGEDITDGVLRKLNGNAAGPAPAGPAQPTTTPPAPTGGAPVTPPPAPAAPGN